MKNIYLSLCLFIVSSSVFFKDVRAENHCPPVLKAQAVARSDFADRLKEHPVKTELQAYASNISHYDIIVSEQSDRVLVRFKLRREGAVFEGGAVNYVVRKSDMKIIDYKVEK